MRYLRLHELLQLYSRTCFPSTKGPCKNETTGLLQANWL